MMMAESSGIPGPSQVCSGAYEEYSDEDFIAVVGQVWGIKIHPQEFQPITPELVQKVYYAFLKDLDVNIEKFNEISPRLLGVIQSSEDYSGATRLTVLSSHMRKYFKLIFNDDTFRLADVFNPKPKRSRKYFAMIYNFLLCTDNYCEELEEKEEEVHGTLVERRDKMKAKLLKLKQLYDERKADNTKSEVSKEEDIRRLEGKTKELQKCQEEKLVLKAKFDALNLSISGLNTTVKDTELRIMEASGEKQRLEGLVIQPSEEEDIRKRNEKLTLLKEDIQKKKDHLAQLQQNMKSKTSHKEKVDKFISLLKEIEQEKSREKEQETHIAESTLQITEVHEKITCQEDKNLQLEQHITLAETKLQNMQQAWDIKQKSLEKEIKEQKQVLEDIHRNQTEQDIAYKDVMDTIDDMEDEIKQSKEKISTINDMIKNKYKLILDVVEGENGELGKALTEVAESLEDFKKLAE